MKVVCSWCRREGREGLVGEKAPLEDQRETHSICHEHEKAVKARWASRRQSVALSMVSTDSRGGYPAQLRRAVLSFLRVYVDVVFVASKARS